jgi:hypothetical protein
VISTLRELVDAKDDELSKLEVKGNSLDKESKEYKERLKETTDSLALERSRYKKLYVLTQDLESEVDRLTKELDVRDRWFRDNMSFFEELPSRVGKRLDMIPKSGSKRSLLEELGEPAERKRPQLAPVSDENATFEKVDPAKEVLKDLMALPGMDETKAKVLVDAGYGNMEKLKAASPFELVKLEGITPTLARKITDHVKS